MQSHRQVLEFALLDGITPLSVLEDDATFSRTFAKEAARFLRRVPADWEGLMFGGQSKEVRAVVPGDLRCVNCQRTHGYAVRGRYLRALYQHWISTAGHCDHRMGELQRRFKVYAPDPFLVG